MKKSEAYWKLAEYERHFNGIQAGIRTRASTWILAAFGAIAVLLKIQSGDSGQWLLSPLVLVGIVSAMGSLGLMVLWINDQLV